MSADTDLIIIGAGPAGQAAAVEASSHGLSVMVLDEQSQPGGQIYRNITRNADNGSKLRDILGRDYMRGAALAREFAKAEIDYRPGASVWQVDPNCAVSFSHNGTASQVTGRRLLIATGAQERPVAIPGWTLPGVMGAGAAQVLLKSAGAVPMGRIAVAGSGPLLLLVTQQLIDAGANVVALLETTRTADYIAAAGTLPGALRAPEYLRKGMAMRRHVKAAGVPIHSGVRGLAVFGSETAEGIRFQSGGAAQEIAADTVLLHEGVVPNVQITRQLWCDHEWVEPQRYWRPVLDDYYNTSIEGIAVAGDSAGIYGAEAAAVAGRIAALDAACRLEKITAADRDREAAPLLKQRSKYQAIRPLLDSLFRPNPEILAPADDETVVCRCEEVSAGTIREGVRLGATGPNQLKSYMRCGMGPCQGRFCGLTVAEIIAAERGESVRDVGYYRIRPPIKPVTLGELAAFDD